MSSPDIWIVRTGTANLASVLAAFKRIGAAPQITDSPAIVRRAERVVLPGVGAFGPAMDTLEEQDLIGALEDRIRLDKPTLAICLGMHLLGTRSEESPDAEGLGVYDAVARRFPQTVTTPQLGWNMVHAPARSRFLSSGFGYFAHSYRLVDSPPGWIAATTDYAGLFSAALERGSVLACQFHPEISGEWGLSLLRRWFHDSLVEDSAAC